jgi:hypothetical protein
MDDAVALQKIIATYCPWNYDQIDLSLPIQDRYVSKNVKDAFTNDICAQWPGCDCTALHNQVFSSLKTGNDILAFIQS